MNIAIENYIAAQSAPNQAILRRFRSIILASFPESGRENFSFKCPFYHYQGMLCYLSVQKGAALLGFCRGVALSAQELLQAQGNKIVRHYRVESVDEIDEEQTLQWLSEALLLNEEAYRVKNKSAQGR